MGKKERFRLMGEFIFSKVRGLKTSDIEEHKHEICNVTRKL